MNIDMTISPREKADAFLKVAHKFQLGVLPTEQRHPKTRDLAKQSRQDVQTAIQIIKDIDIGVVRDIIAKQPELQALQYAMKDTLDSGGRIFFYGCGATGRLSLSIEYAWRFVHQDDPDMANRVFGFMTGGDVALVYAMESFEDYPEIGARHLHDMGFQENDLLVSCTEGGETPSVIGATEEAAKVSKRKPFFLYSNPDDLLIKHVERSRRVLENDAIHKICLFVGPMAISGSTRLQSTTALQLGVGYALMQAAGKTYDLNLEDFASFLMQTDFSFLEDFAKAESAVYENKDYMLYETDIYGMTILTDTTERAPTFSLQNFENRNDENPVPALAYIYMPHAKAPEDGWQGILLRQPFSTEWPESKGLANTERLMGFDFSNNALRHRTELVYPAQIHRFRIARECDDMIFSLGEHEHKIDVSSLHPLMEQLFLKILLNIHSALVMGRLKRIESNIMTWVKPSNNKLIDRAIRYIAALLENDGITDYSYEDICYQLFEDTAHMGPADPIVLLTYNSLKERHKRSA